MTRVGRILIFGLVLGLLGYAVTYFLGTATHSTAKSGPAPELAWLKSEFHLGDAEFTRIVQLHEQYRSGCAERCRQIDTHNQELAKLLAASDHVTPEITRLLAQSAQLRAECQRAMLEHFYAVSRTMPPDQGRRYLAWVQELTILTDTHATMAR